jgi:hypothetical protein
MFRQIKAAALAACAILLGSVVVVGQASKPQHPADAERASLGNGGKSAALGCVGCELPIMLRQNVVAGKTAAGTKVDGQLIMATMMKGGVIPRGALISGEVIESVAKSHDSASRLAIRMDSAQWKNGGVKFKGYLTAWYYPPAPIAPPNLAYGPPGEHRNWGGTDPTVDTTDPPNPAQRLSTQDNGMNTSAPGTVIAKERVLMKNVEATRDADGSIVLVSSRSSIKLSKVTAYVLAVDESLPGK